jgi:hypothetical protein
MARLYVSFQANLQLILIIHIIDAVKASLYTLSSIASPLLRANSRTCSPQFRQPQLEKPGLLVAKA